jgi:ferritin-like metal-binding protein YciE
LKAAWVEEIRKGWQLPPSPSRISPPLQKSPPICCRQAEQSSSGVVRCSRATWGGEYQLEDKSMVTKTLDNLFHETLKDVYYAERKILKALPKMARGAESPELKAAFEKHRDETEVHVERLQQIFAIFGKRAQGKTCDAIEGIIAEGEEVLEDFKGQPALDAGLISSAQAVEHYEMARYGTLARWAEELGIKDATALLLQTLEEEIATDAALTKLAETGVNSKAQNAA